MEVWGEEGHGRFWATYRVLFQATELATECRAATHVVAAFAVVGGPYAPPADGSTEPVRFSAILVPLPCPSIEDPTPAPGCIGRGMTGPERLERGLSMREHTSPEELAKRPVSFLLEIYALLSDDRRGTLYFHERQGLPRLDCFVQFQGQDVHTSTPPSAWTTFSDSPDAECSAYPPFMTCFGGLFDPGPGKCWTPAKPRP